MGTMCAAKLPNEQKSVFVITWTLHIVLVHHRIDLNSYVGYSAPPVLLLAYTL